MKIAILGGSFNPVHLGHLFLADGVISAFGYDRVIMIPTFQSPFKPGAPITSAEDRLDMLAASITADPRLTVDDSEIRRQGVSYTIDTLGDIERRYLPQGKPALILGDDLARDFPQWKKAQEIAERADIIIAHRISSEELPFPFPHRRLKNDIMDLSSGMVRDRIRQGESWRYLVPQAARLIIEDRGLYGVTPAAVPRSPEPVLSGGEGSGSPTVSWALIGEIETVVRHTLASGRFLHSRNTALLTYDICLRFHLDAAAGYLAGIAHDMAKPLPEDVLIRLAGSDGQGISPLEYKKVSLLHARAAAVLLKDRFGVHNESILEAVRFHTTGDMSMGPLAKAVFIADKIEPSRQEVDPRLRELNRYHDLEDLFTAVVDETVVYLSSRNVDISESTKRLLAAIHKRRM
ncbi:nicotinate (nicotinamide) nucleotide adenylyltransferase [Treponema sp. TIM-1]|uniref:nicotinate (nicotinamide) nucleotide adenylyltransferase n=1 Tax=Treponema sp. TIM-1 TaxID=2898417 RepID=UPI00397EECD3